MLLVAIPACYKDVHLVLRNLVLCASFERGTSHHALLMLDGSLTAEQCSDLYEAARRYFAAVHRVNYDSWKGDMHWPVPQNYAWQSTARHIEGTFGDNKTTKYTGWLWWEGDAVPLRSTWLDAIEAAHVAGKQPFTGHLRENAYMNGVGVWPIRISDWLAESGALYVRGAGFDRQAGSDVRAHLCAINHLILHQLKTHGGGEGVHFDKASAERLLAQNTQAVLYHGCTDGSLQTHLSNGVLGSIETPSGERKTSSTQTFYHSGSLGDVIYSLPTIKALGGGVLYLGPVPTTRQRARNPIFDAEAKFLAPLLQAQSYITEVKYTPDLPKTDFDLNIFRRHYDRPRADRTTSLAALHLRAFRLDENLCTEPWLSVVPVTPPAPVLINRTDRYRNASFDWKSIIETYQCGFVGLEEEYDAFCFRQSCDNTVKFIPTADALALAKLIAGSALFVGNQSLCYAIAEGLKHRTIQETYGRAPDCIYPRDNAIYARTALETLPPIDAPLVTISIACYEKAALTRKCLQSVIEHTPQNVRIVVTDNGSLDETPQLLAEMAELDPRLKVVSRLDNSGYKEPHNSAFAQSQSPFFVILNNDVVVGKNWLEPMVSAMQSDSKLGVVGALGSCSMLSKDMHGSPGPSLEYIEGSCMMVRRSAALSVGSELFAPYVNFAYGEDSDLSLRLREKGYTIAALSLPVKHVRCATARIVPARYNLELHRDANHAALRNRWRVYLQRRSFDYRVLLKRDGAMGDVLFLTPIIEALKAKWPQCSIVVQTKCPQVLLNNPLVALATPQPQPDSTFDYVYDLNLSYESRPHMHAVHAYADAVNVVLPQHWSFRMHPSGADKNWASDLVRGNESVALLHIGPTTWRGKNWPIDRFDEIGRFLRLHGYRVVLVGTESPETIRNHDLDLRGKTTPQQLAALAARAAIFVGLDSFPAHVAEAAHCSVVNICGVCNAQLRSMETVRTICVPPSAEVPCSYELHRLEPPVTYAPCEGACIDSISVNAVKRAITTHLGIEPASDLDHDNTTREND